MSELVTIALIVIVAQLWSRLNKLQARVAELELQGAPVHFFEPDHVAPLEPEPVEQAAEEEHHRPLRIIQSEPVPEPTSPLLEEPVFEDQPIADFPDAEAEHEQRKFGFEDIFGRKLPICAREGVSHLWLVDPVARVLETYRLVASSYIFDGAFGEHDRVRIEPFAAIELELAALWPGPPEQ